MEKFVRTHNIKSCAAAAEKRRNDRNPLCHRAKSIWKRYKGAQRKASADAGTIRLSCKCFGQNDRALGVRRKGDYRSDCDIAEYFWRTASAGSAAANSRKGVSVASVVLLWQSALHAGGCG